MYQGVFSIFYQLILNASARKKEKRVSAIIGILASLGSSKLRVGPVHCSGTVSSSQRASSASPERFSSTGQRCARRRWLRVFSLRRSERAEDYPTGCEERLGVALSARLVRRADARALRSVDICLSIAGVMLSCDLRSSFCSDRYLLLFCRRRGSC